MVNHLSTDGNLYIFACNVSDGQIVKTYEKFLKPDQAIWTHKREVKYVSRGAMGVPMAPTGEWYTEGQGVLYMYKSTK